MMLFFFFILFINNLKGLDPAFPLYMFINPSTRLSADAADFVDIIHTDGGVLGYPWPLGHAGNTSNRNYCCCCCPKCHEFCLILKLHFFPDFYPNQGTFQPGCAKQELSKNRWYSIVGKSEMPYTSNHCLLLL